MRCALVSLGSLLCSIFALISIQSAMSWVVFAPAFTGAAVSEQPQPGCTAEGAGILEGGAASTEGHTAWVVAAVIAMRLDMYISKC
jgi:hypothetical protein